MEGRRSKCSSWTIQSGNLIWIHPFQSNGLFIGGGICLFFTPLLPNSEESVHSGDGGLNTYGFGKIFDLFEEEILD